MAVSRSRRAYGRIGILDVLRVDRAVKGQPGPVVVITQPGGLEPANQDWTGVVIAQTEAQPLLLPGDRAMLLLNADGSGRSIQPFSGYFRVGKDTVHGLHGNPAASVLEGLPLESVIDRVLKELE